VAVGKTMGACLTGALVLKPPPAIVEIVVREPAPPCTAATGAKFNAERNREPTRRSVFIADPWLADALFCQAKRERERQVSAAIITTTRNPE